MKRTLFIPMLFAAMLVAGCQDEPAVTNEPVDSTYTPPVDSTYTPPADDTVTAYIPIPLAEYLPGTWVIDGTVLASFVESDEYPEGHWYYEYGYDYEYNDSLVFTDSTVYTTVMGGSIGPYVILDSNTIQMQLPLYQEWWMYEFSERSIIYQLDSNRMLIHGYLPNHSFLGYIQESLDAFTYLFTRQGVL